MLVKLVVWLMGSRDFHVEASHAEQAATLLIGSGANFRELHRGEEGLTFSLPLSDCAPLLRIYEKHQIGVKVLRERGAAALLSRYRRRIGIPIGMLLFFIILFLSEQYIWTIRVVGNDSVPAQLILARLDELGVGVGSYIPKIDFDWVHNQYLIEYDDLAWISVNVRGTFATVEVRELQAAEAVPDESTPYNLIATEDGIVRSVEILRGEPVAEIDSLVREGELLASGVEATKSGYRLLHARGSVKAEVKRRICVEVPLQGTARSLSGEEYREKYLKLFGFSVQYFSNIGSMPAQRDIVEYEQVETERALCLFGVIELPISVREVVLRAYCEIPIERTEEEARAEAYRRLRAECAALNETSELLSRTISAELSDGVYHLICELHVLTEIAKEAPIYTS